VSVHCLVSFALIFYLTIHCTLISLTPHYSSLPFFPTPYCSAVFSAFHCVLFMHRCDVFQYYSLHIILSFSSSSNISVLVFQDIFSMSVYVCVYKYILKF
jgi:hypothetical protein